MGCKLSFEDRTDKDFDVAVASWSNFVLQMVLKNFAVYVYEAGLQLHHVKHVVEIDAHCCIQRFQKVKLNFLKNKKINRLFHVTSEHETYD